MTKFSLTMNDVPGPSKSIAVTRKYQDVYDAVKATETYDWFSVEFEDRRLAQSVGNALRNYGKKDGASISAVVRQAKVFVKKG